MFKIGEMVKVKRTGTVGRVVKRVKSESSRVFVVKLDGYVDCEYGSNYVYTEKQLCSYEGEVL